MTEDTDVDRDLRDVLSAVERAAPAPADLTRRLLAAVPSRRADVVARRRPSWLLPVLAAAVVALIALISAFALVASRGGPTKPALSITPQPSVSILPSRHRTRRAVAAGTRLGPWGGSVVGGPAAAGVPLAGTSTSLYVNDEDADQILRIAPASGAVLARRHLSVAALDEAVVVGGIVWLATDPASDSARPVLLGLDADTLATVATLRFPHFAGRSIALTADPDTHRLYVGVGPSVRIVDATSGRLISSYRAPGAYIDNLAISPDGTRLYLSYGELSSDEVTLVEADPNSGQLLGNSLHGYGAGGLTASTGGIWASTGTGHTDEFVFRTADGLDAPTGHTTVVQGGGGVPNTVTATPSVVWQGGTNDVACSDPATGHTRAHATVPPRHHNEANVAFLVPAGRQLFASYQGSGTGALLVRLTPPAACTP